MLPNNIGKTTMPLKLLRIRSYAFISIDLDPLNAKSSGSSDSFLYDAATTITFTCRICLDDETDRSLVLAPCSCAGSQKWVHRACLDRWRATREDK